MVTEMSSYTRTIGEILEGEINNMSDAEIDRDLKLFAKIGRLFKMKHYDDIICLISDDYDPKWIESETNDFENLGKNVYVVFGITMYREELNGNIYLYFKNEDECEKYCTEYDNVMYNDYNEQEGIE